MKFKLLTILMLVALIALSACSPSTTTDGDKTIQEEAAEVAQASNNGASADEIIDEVEDVIQKLPAQGASESDSSFSGYGMTYVVDGVRYTNEVAPVLGETPVAGFMTITSPDSLGIQLRMLPNEVGTYKAGEGPSEYRLVDVWFPHEGVRYDANADKGSATITLTEVGTMGWPYQGDVAGTFSGTFVDAIGNEIKVTDGEFRGTAS